MAHLDVIRIRGLEVDCVVGVYPHERHEPQPLVLDAELWLDTELAARKERLGRSIDYAQVSDQLAFLLRNGRFRMLETAAHALCRYLLAPPAPAEQRARLARARVTLTKPTALGGRAVPSLEITRDASWVALTTEQKAFGTVDVIHETRDAGIYRLNIAPGRAIPLHVHRVMQETEMVLTSGLWCQGRPVPAGTVHRWPKGAAHCYDNPTRRTQTVLCVDSPPFTQEDEIAVTGAPADVQAEA
ncbi:MAG: dihydroneopterin aldolase [Polyangiales bacterium]